MPEPLPFPLISLQLVSDRNESVCAFLLRIFQPGMSDGATLLGEPDLLELCGVLPCLVPFEDVLELDALPVPPHRIFLLPSPFFDEARARNLAALGFEPTTEALALNVDSREHLSALAGTGTRWFAGDWYLQPRGGDAAGQAGSGALMLRLLKLLAADADNAELEEVFKQDPHLSYQLLKLVNSVAMGLPRKIGSFSQAIAILGRRQLRRWLHLLIFVRQQNECKLSPLLASAMLRARLLELLAKALGVGVDGQEEAFVTGMFSLLHVVFGMSPAQLIQPLNLADDIVAALLERRGELGTLLRLAQGAERGDGAELASLLGAIGLPSRDFALAQFQACRWMLDVCRELDGG